MSDHPGDAPREVRITVSAGPRRPRDGLARAGLRAVVMLAAAALIAAVGRVGGPWPNARAMVPGPDGVAAAYGYPLRCVSVTTAGPDRAYARVDLDRAAACGRFGWAATAIFHRSDGAWRRVLDASSYTCPAVAVPQAVQAELSVCP